MKFPGYSPFGFRMAGLLVALLCLMFFLPQPAPARASSNISPGFYDGWVHYLARIDFQGHYSPTGGGSDYQSWDFEFEGRGHLMVKINDAGAGGASIVLPTVGSETYMDDWDSGNGSSCTTNESTWASSNYVHLRGAPAAMGDTFQVPFKPAAALIFTDQAHTSSVTGEYGGCEHTAVEVMDGEKVNIKNDLAQISAIQFQTTYHSDTQMGGTCSIPGWVKKVQILMYPTPSVSSLPKCFWRVVKSGQGKSQKGWK